MSVQVVPAPLSPALSHSSEVDLKPAMAGQRPSGLPATPAPAGAGQGRCPVDPRRPLPSVLGVKLSADLRARIKGAAEKAGVSDSAWLRQQALVALGVESPVDAASGRRPRLPPEEQAALAGIVRDLGEATLAARAGRTDDAVSAMERARQTLIPVVIGFERRPS